MNENEWPEWTPETYGNDSFWNENTCEFNPSNVVHLGAGLIVPKRFNARFSAGEILVFEGDDSSLKRLFDKAEGVTQYSVSLEWNQETDCFLTKSFHMVLDEKWLNGDINGTLLRTVRVQDIINEAKEHQSFFIFRGVKNERGYADEFFLGDPFLKIDGKYPEEWSGKGPVPAVLLFVARAYLALSALRSTPHKYIEGIFDIPPRTASHWIKLSRERGYFDKSLFQECEDFINGAS